MLLPRSKESGRCKPPLVAAPERKETPPGLVEETSGQHSEKHRSAVVNNASVPNRVCLRTDSPFASYVITATRFPMLPSVVLDSVSACSRCVFLTLLNPEICCCVLTASYSASPVCQRLSDHLQWPRIPKLMLQITRHIALYF